MIVNTFSTIDICNAQTFLKLCNFYGRKYSFILIKSTNPILIKNIIQNFFIFIAS